MAEDILDVWKDNLKNCLSSISSFNKWLIILNLTTLFTYVEFSSQLLTQKKIYATSSAGLQKPWHLLQLFYDDSKNSLEQYDSTQLVPWVSGNFATWWGTFILNNFIDPAAKQKTAAALQKIDFARKALNDYSADVTKIVSAQENNKPFQDLTTEQLLSLINIFNFAHLHQNDSLADGLRNTSIYAAIIQDPRFIKGFTGGAAPSPTLINTLLFVALDTPFHDFVAKSGLLLRDFNTFALKNIEDSFAVIRTYLRANPYQTFATLTNSVQAAGTKIHEIVSDETVSIPLIETKISLIGFVILAGLINLIIIFYLRNTLKNTLFVWKNYTHYLTPYPKDLAPAYFYNWIWGSNRYHLFLLTYSLFLAFISLISFILAFVLYTYIKNAIYVIGTFALVNSVLAVRTSKAYFDLRHLTATSPAATPD